MAENDFQRASLRGLGKKILLGDEPTEITPPAEIPVDDDPAVLKLTSDEEQDLLAVVPPSIGMTQAPVAEEKSQEAIPPLEYDMPHPAKLAGESLPLPSEMQSLVEEAFESAEQIVTSPNIEARPHAESDGTPFVTLNPAEAVLPTELQTIIDENADAPIAAKPPTEQPAPTPQTNPIPSYATSSAPPIPAERNELTHLLPLIAGWIVAVLVLIYQLMKDRDDEKTEKDR
jgi:hypothetical protein